MTTISFKKQLRNDNGARSRIIINGETTWMHFEPGSDTDMSVLWYIYVEFKGENLPLDPETSRKLFVDYSHQIGDALTEVIEYLQEHDGILAWPASSDEQEITPGVKMTAVCSAIRRMRAREILPQIVELRDNWRQHIEQLELVAPVAAK